MGYAAGVGFAWYGEIAAAVGLTALARVLGLSMGRALLDYALEEAEADSPRWLWPNLVVGTFLILDGLKMMVRWSQFDVAIPVFGMIETTVLKVVVLVAMGAISFSAGAMVLAFMPKARLAAAGAIALSTVSLFASWPVLGEAVARVQAARREAQGLPLREGEIDAMQSLLPVISLGGLVVCAAFIWLSRERSS
jgi:hypothetical protein